ncbi:MAG: glycosyltransferase [Burkholderiales bacterium]|nr:glycosyltransferase [Burkholderiales bacterium]
MKAAVFRLQLFKPSETFVAAQALSLPNASVTLVGRNTFGPPVPGLNYWMPPRLSSARLAAYLAAGIGDPFVPFFKDWRPDIVHAHFAVDGLYALDAARTIGCPLVTTLHGFDVTTRRGDFLRSRRPALMRYALQQSRLKRQGDLFICVSNFMLHRALAAGFPAGRLVQHYIGINPDDFCLSVHDGPPRVLHVARLVEKKGTRYLIDAFARVAPAVPEADLVVVGDGPLLTQLQEQAAGLGIAERVSFLGAQPHEEVKQLMSHSSVLVLPSLTASNGDAEGLGMVLLEAAASGLPVVGTRHGGIPEAVEDGRTGCLVAERDAGAIADALEPLLKSSSLRLEWGRAGRQMVQDRFDIAHQGRELKRLFMRAAA